MSSSRRDSTPPPTAHAVCHTHSRSAPPHPSINRKCKSSYSEHTPDTKLGELGPDVQSLRARAELDARYSEIEVEITAVKARLREREIRRQELKGITGELSVAQRFLSMAHGLSQTEVVRATESLNEEIFQLTSIVAGQLSVEERKCPDSHARKAIFERSPWLDMMDPYFDIVTFITLDDSLAVQIGWQAVLVQICSVIINTWELEDQFCDQGQLNDTLRDMYLGIQSDNDHAVSRRWRSMVYGATNDISSEAQEKILHRIVGILVDLAVVCGYILTQEVFDRIFISFRDRIGPLFDKCLQVRKMVGKDITSRDTRAYFFMPGKKYDSHLPADLEHENEEKGSLKDKGGIIACSVSLGLYCVRESRGDKQNKRPILKPKVILQQTLKEIIS